MVAAVPPHRLRKVCELYLAGHSFVEIQKILHIGQVPIQRALAQAEIKSRRRTKRPTSEKKKADIVAYYQAGHTLNECIRQFRVTSTTAADALKEAEVEQRYFWTEEDVQTLIGIYAEGLSLTECAAVMRTNNTQIRIHLKKAGVRIRTQKEATKRGKENWYYNEDKVVCHKYKRVQPKEYHNSVYEHRHVMEKKIGRPLLDEEVVHHDDGDLSNNDPDNLMLFENQTAHMEYHVELQRRRLEERNYQYASERRKKLRSKSDGHQ